MARVKKIIYKLNNAMSMNKVTKYKYKLKNALMKLLPKKIRRPVQLALSIFSLWAYLHLMIRISNSEFLILGREYVLTAYGHITSRIDTWIVAVFWIALIAIIMRKYMIEPIQDEYLPSKKKKSLVTFYDNVNLTIFLCFVVITIFAFVPIFI